MPGYPFGMRSLLLLWLATGLVACSNDEFTGGDASVSDASDGSSNTDAIGSEGGSADGGSADACLPNATVGGCTSCTQQTCCVSATTVCNDPGCVGFNLACRTGADCIGQTSDGGGGFICCLEFDAGITPGCPTTIKGVSGKAACVSLGNCDTTGFFRLCTNDKDCAIGTHCTRATFALNGNVQVGVCE